MNAQAFKMSVHYSRIILCTFRTTGTQAVTQPFMKNVIETLNWSNVDFFIIYLFLLYPAA